MTGSLKLHAWTLVGLSLLVLTRCNCGDQTCKSCTIDGDCPAEQTCVGGCCRVSNDFEEQDGGGDDGFQDSDDGGGGSEGWDPGQPDGDVHFPCNDQSDCQAGEVCFNYFCVRVIPDADCVPGPQDHCANDTFCEPSLGGCVDWEVHPLPAPDCDHIPPIGLFTPGEEWVWQNPAVAPEWDEVMMTPAVSILTDATSSDLFRAPAVIFNSFRKDLGYSQNGVLRAVTGTTGEPLFSVTNPDHYTHPVSNIAVGDIDGDNLAEIVTGKSGGRDLICFENDGTFKWATSGGALAVGWGGPAIANIDYQGPPEIVIGAAVVNADGTIRWNKTGAQCSNGPCGRGDNYAEMGESTAPFSVPADVYDDIDGKVEIVTGDTLYDYLGNEIWNTGYGDGFVAVANFYGRPDSPPEIVVVSRGSVRLQSSLTGEILWLKDKNELALLPACEPNCGLLGPPTIADFDGDGNPEIGVAGADVYVVLDTTGDVVWSVQTRDGSSNITGSAVFDFEGDGKAEVVYADEVSLKVFRGANDPNDPTKKGGDVLYEQPHSSLTACEYPVIADVDSDHGAEIVIAQNDLMEDAPATFKGIRVFKDANDNWVNTRRIWNQHAYSVTNINENSTVPVQAEKNWQNAGLNNFRQNVQGEGLFDAPDLTVEGAGFQNAECRLTGILLYAEVFNRGLLEIPPGLPVSFYQGDPRSGGTKLSTSYTSDVLKPGDSEVVTALWPNPPLDTPTTFFVVADDGGWDAAHQSPTGIHAECRELNNLGVIPDVVCKPDT